VAVRNTCEIIMLARFFKTYGYSIASGAFSTFFVSAFAHGLGYNKYGFWFLVLANWFAFTIYFLERGKAEKRQQEINRYRKNGIRKK
jgi:hypothetical protein